MVPSARRAPTDPSARRRLLALALGTLIVAAVVASVSLMSLGGGSTSGRHRTAGATAPAANRSPAAGHAKAAPQPERFEPIPRMLGQMIIARFSGPTPSTSFLARIRSGQVGGVVLFADNVGGGLRATRALIVELQRTARQGGNPPLLILTDQEGGKVSRLPGPPTLAPSQMTTPDVALAQGRSAGGLLRSLGVNVDLAPVADVERAAGSFLGTRSFGSLPAEVAADACAFARGLTSQHVGYTLKHFPGLGRAVQSTDVAPQSISGPAGELRSDYGAYRACGGSPRALVMISNAIYPDLTGPLPAVMSRLTYRRELPIATGGAPVVTISDDLQAGAIADQSAPARHAINAGLDLLMYAGTEGASADAYATLLGEVRAGLVSKGQIRAASSAIQAFKRQARATISSR